MAKKRTASDVTSRNKGNETGDVALDYRHHHARRPNNPTAANAAEGKIDPTSRLTYSYDPHRPPNLQFDATGRADILTDRMSELLEAAQSRALNASEAAELADALRQGQPWLEWAGKREHPAFIVDSPAIHIHERVSTRALLRIAARRDVQRSLFGDPEQPYAQSVQFYRHSVNWSNRLILGDNRAVMASLAQREGFSGKVQMIYIDPPYGIKYGSNFQPEINRKDVRDTDNDLTREMEAVRAYRDTWNIGVHSYLNYIRQLLILSKELLSDTGSVFLQIGDSNLQYIKDIADEVFGREQFVSIITVKKTATPSRLLDSGFFYVVWYCKNNNKIYYNQLYIDKPCDEWARDTPGGSWGVEIEGYRRPLRADEKKNTDTLPSGSDVYRLSKLKSAGPSGDFKSFEFNGMVHKVDGNTHWKTTADGMKRLIEAGRIEVRENNPWFVWFHSDSQVKRLSNLFEDTSGKSSENEYIVKTPPNVIQRCMLMTTKPGELVLDPTCGGATSAYVAEQWGRRWITIDTSRVALAIARQRVMTARFDYYRLRDELNGPTGGFYYKSVPHVTLKSIAQNAGLDSIFSKHERILADRLLALNSALSAITPYIRSQLESKLAAKRMANDKKDPLTEADERRWSLPAERWEEWKVPFDTDPDWPQDLQEALVAYRKAWRTKMNEVNAAIAANAKQEALVDQPEVVKGIVRVSGPFTVEALQPAEESLEGPSPVDELKDELETFGPDAAGGLGASTNVEAYRDKMLRLLRADGVRFPNNVQVRFESLESLEGGILSAAGEWRPESEKGEPQRVAVVFGPQYGPITGTQVESSLRSAYRARIYDDLVFAGFSFDSAAQTVIQDDPNPKVRCHLAFIRPDVNLTGLLKETPHSQLFTVFGLPRASLEPVEDGRFRVRMEGVDVYNPVTNEIVATGADKVAAWFVDSDYDGRTFCICQAFFPNRSAWDKLGKALKGLIDEDRFTSLSGTVSQPFDPPNGDEPRVAVKVIDPRGNEVMRVLRMTRGA